MQGRPVNALVLPVQPARQGTPHVIDTGNLPGTEEIFLHESYAVLDILNEYSFKMSYTHTFFIRTLDRGY